MSSYHFYLYDETDDGVDLRLWEWPRLTPQDAQLANNGICEDGLPAVNSSIPQGDYYVAFGSPDCAVHHVNLSTALVSGCGRIDLVPCVVGTDCKDCGRSASATAEPRVALASKVLLQASARAAQSNSPCPRGQMSPRHRSRWSGITTARRASTPAAAR